MAENKYTTIQQHEPLRVPEGWGQKEKRFVAQLEEILDDIYRRFGRLKIKDMSEPLQEDIQKGVNASFEVTKLEDGLNAKADKKIVDPNTGEETTLSTLATLTAEGFAAVVSGATPVGAVDSTTVKVGKDGVHIGTTGTFSVDSGNFSLDGDGNMSCSDANINGKLLNQGQKVLTPLDIYVGSTEPVEKRQGMIWIRPKQNSAQTSSQTTHTYTYDRDRLGLASNPIYGSFIGSPAEAAGDNYFYEIDIPVYLGGRVDGATVTIDILGNVFYGTVTGNQYDHRTIHIEERDSDWFANASNIPFILSASSNNVLNDRAGQYQIRLVSRSSAG